MMLIRTLRAACNVDQYRWERKGIAKRRTEFLLKRFLRLLPRNEEGMAMNLLYACGSCFLFLFFSSQKYISCSCLFMDRDEISIFRNAVGPIAFLMHLVEDHVRYPREKSVYHCCQIHKSLTKSPGHENIKAQLRFMAPGVGISSEGF